jgi:hypothetical protein
MDERLGLAAIAPLGRQPFVPLAISPLRGFRPRLAGASANRPLPRDVDGSENP